MSAKLESIENHQLEPGTHVQVTGFDLSGQRTYEDAVILPASPDSLPMPPGYHRVRFDSGGVLQVHQQRMVISNPSPEQYRRAASEHWGHDPDIDFDHNTLVSEGEDGAYVQAWLWVPRDRIKVGHGS